MSNDPQPGTGMAKGAAWMVLFKIIDRTLGLISMVILARLLVPADFGVIALAMSLITLFELLGAFGLDTALIQRADARREHFDTVWTFQVLFGLATAIVVGALAWPAAWFYDDPRLVPVMLVLGLARAVQGFENVGIIAFRKEMRFEQDFRFLLAKRLATTVLVTIPLAFALRSYWALILGTLAGTCIALALSYAMHPFRPRPSLAALKQLMGFSKWLFVTSLVEFFYSRAADLIVARWAGASALGQLTIAREIARVPTRELAAPVHRAVFPGYVKLADDRSLLREQYLKVTSVLLLLIVPAGVGLSLLAQPLVLALLGDQWQPAVPLVQVLAINGVLAALVSTAHHANLAVGNARATSLVLGVHACLSVPLMLWWVPSQGAVGAALAILVASILTAPLNFQLLARAIRFGVRELFAILVRPCVGSLAMSGAVLLLAGQWPMPGGLAARIFYIAVFTAAGALTYTGCVFLLWRWSGSVDSAEAWVLDKVTLLAAGAGRRLGIRSR